jgi:nucleoside 2-deoxyribosyltransferase
MISSVYIAAPYPAREAAIDLMATLDAAGFEVTSSWLVEDDMLTDEFARKDLDDIDRADALVAMNPPEWAERGTGGRHVEFGYALAQGKPIVLVGARSNIFHHLMTVHVVTEDELVDTLRGLV